MNNKCLLLIVSLIIFLIGCKDETPFEPHLSVSPDKLEIFTSEGGETMANVDANLDWVAIPSATWIDVSPSSGNAKTKSVRILTHSNEKYDGRTGQVVFHNYEYGISDTVHVSQVQKDAILMTCNTYEIGSEGGDIAFKVSSNVNFNVYSDQPWVKRKESRGLTQTILSFTIDANTDFKARTATLSIKTANIEQKVTILQAGYDDKVERNALIALYNATNGDNWKNNTNWCSDKPLGEWYGVSTDYSNKIYSINLNYNNMQGSIPAELGKLTNLEFLQFYDSGLSGTIPAELGNLSKLKTLSLGVNQLTGSIPVELGNLINLETLNLYYNQLSGTIPAELGNLSKLKTLSLGVNQLTGSIPVELGNLINLETLNLYYNQLSGTIPAELGNLSKLKKLSLGVNQLTGSIPVELGNLINLETLNLYYNQLTGEIPAFIGNMKSYANVLLYYNNLAGTPPVKVTEHADWHIYWPQLVSGSKVNLTQTDINGPEFTVTDMNGQIVKSAELYENNTITILYKWGKWCGYSLQYNETLKKIYEQYHNKGLEILGSYSSNNETENEAKDYIDKNIPWPNYFMSSGNEEKETAPNWITQFGLISAVPEIIVVNSNKKVIFQGFTEDRFDLPLILVEYF